MTVFNAISTQEKIRVFNQKKIGKKGDFFFIIVYRYIYITIM